MTNLTEIENRIETLETKIMFQDEVIEQLNRSLVLQHLDFKKLKSLVERLNAQLEDIQQPNIATASEEAPPPHY
jgi:SlyX protein